MELREAFDELARALAAGEPFDDPLAALDAAIAGHEDYLIRRHALLEAAFDSVIAMDADGIAREVNRQAEKTFGYAPGAMVGREVAELIVPPSLRDAHRRGLARYLQSGTGPIVGRRVELTAMRADGREFPVELVVTRPDPSAAIFYGYLRDITSRRRAEQSLHRLADEQAALRRVATAVAAGADAGSVFDLVSEEVGRLLGARTAHMYRYDADGGVAVIVGAWALASDQRLAAGTRMVLDGDTATTRVWKTGAPQRQDSYEDVPGTLASTLRGYGVQSVVAAPVSLGGRLWGGVIISSMEREPFPPDTEQRIADFAELAAQALANAQAREDLAASRARIVQAGDEERRRLERNLHDGAQQRLVSLALMLRLAARRHPDDEQLERAAEELAQALTELRELARGLHPAILTEHGLEPAVQSLAARAPLPVELQIALEERLPPAVEAAGYYVVAEALANVAKYAHANVVGVRVGRDDGRAWIEVSDDGVGGAQAGAGSGLRGLADRVEALGGRFAVDSPPGHGTTLRAELPV